MSSGRLGFEHFNSEAANVVDERRGHDAIDVALYRSRVRSIDLLDPRRLTQHPLASQDS